MTSESTPNRPESLPPVPPIADPLLPDLTLPPLSPPPSASQIILKCARLVLARNPFYILSAVLLLLSMRRLSLDSRIFPRELPQLLFNFSSLEIYELLLAGTAILLARRRIFYDSGLLVGLENLLVCVPFILVSQALLLTNETAAAICVAGGVFAVVRVAVLMRGLTKPNLPKALLWAGAAILGFNLGWPVWVRYLHQSRTLAAWDILGVSLSFWEWNWIAPMLVALVWLLPLKAGLTEAKPGGETPFYSQPLFPLLTLLLWAAGTAVHLYCISFVYWLPFKIEMLLPAMWVAAWIPWRELQGQTTTQNRALLARLSLFGPAAMALASAYLGDDSQASMLAALSVAGYSAIALRRREGLAAKLAAASAAFALAFAPVQLREMGVSAAPNWGHGQMLCALGLVVMVGWAAFSKNAKLGFFGGMCLGLGLVAVLPSTATNLNLAAQAGLAFILLHSLRWNDISDREADTARILCAAFWLGDAVGWILVDDRHGIYGTLLGGALVLVIYLGVRVLLGHWGSRVIAIAASAVTVSGPAVLAVRLVMRMPDGVLILLGSFALFAVGTVAALTKSRWLPKMAPPQQG